MARPSPRLPPVTRATLPASGSAPSVAIGASLSGSQQLGDGLGHGLAPSGCAATRWARARSSGGRGRRSPRTGCPGSRAAGRPGRGWSRPRRRAPGSRPKRSVETAASVAATAGSSGGAIQPWAAASRSMVTCAPSSVRDGRDRARRRPPRRRRRAAAAARTSASSTGAARCRRPAAWAARRRRSPRARRPRCGPTRRSTGSAASRCSPSTTGAALSGNSAASASRLARCASGIPAPSSSGRRMRPVASSSIPDRMRRRMRKDDGHHAAALPAVDALGQHVDAAPWRRGCPRSDVVSHSRS